MEAVGNQVVVAILIMFAPILFLILYYWNTIKQFYLRQVIVNEVPIQEPQQRQGIRQQRNDTTCSICLSNPKQFEVSSTCAHSFCAGCIFLIYQRNPAFKIKCPLCRNDMSVIFKCFRQQMPTQEGIEYSNKIRSYNLMFDDNRPFIRKLLEFPYILKRLLSYIFSAQFIVFFIRNIYFIRLVFVILFYVIMPFDILPQGIVGIIGYIDDFLVFILVTCYILAIVGVQYYRAHH